MTIHASQSLLLFKKGLGIISCTALAPTRGPHGWWYKSSNAGQILTTFGIFMSCMSVSSPLQWEEKEPSFELISRRSDNLRSAMINQRIDNRNILMSLMPTIPHDKKQPERPQRNILLPIIKAASFDDRHQIMPGRPWYPNVPVVEEISSTTGNSRNHPRVQSPFSKKRQGYSNKRHTRFWTTSLSLRSSGSLYAKRQSLLAQGLTKIAIWPFLLRNDKLFEQGI